MTSNSPPDEKYPARQVLLENSETVLRAVVEEEWVPGINRGSPSIFRRPHTSVTRIDNVGLVEGISIVKRDVEKPGRPERDLRGVGQISVELIKEVGASPVPVRKPGPCIHMLVWEEKVKAKDGRPENPHHAEIVAYDDEQHTLERRNISLGYSRMLSKALHIYSVDPTGSISGESPPLEWSKADDDAG
jgi:hypothetical protein